MKEELEITVFMLVNYWKDIPEFSIYVDEREIDIDRIDIESGKLLEKTFKTGLLDFSDHKISIELKNKTAKDIVRDSNGIVIRETNMVLFSIAVNNFRTPINDLLVRHGRFVTPNGVDHEVKNLPLTIKHNGRFEFRFTSPFAYWAVKHL